MAFTLIQVGIAAALLFISRLFLKDASSEGEISEDDSPTTLSNRGAYVPLILGRRRVGYVFGAAANRRSTQESVGSASGGKGGVPSGGGSITQTVYFEDGWHIICVGPANKLWGIYENGKPIWTGPISAATTPSGTVIDAGAAGQFIIYWGFHDQPVEGRLASAIGVNSRWPMVCYIYWIQKRLGQSPAWPSIEYDIECACPSSTLGSAKNILDDGQTRGINPHACLFQLLTAYWPHGIGLDPDLVDATSLAAMGVTCENEHLCANLLIDGGMELATIVNGILLDIGCMVPEKDGRLLFNLIRPGLTPADLGNDVVLAEDAEIETIQNDALPDRIVFTFKRRENNYRDWDIKYDNDAIAEEHNRFRSKTVQMVVPTQLPVAKKIANRRVQEVLGDAASFKFKASRAASLLLPGDLFTANDALGPMRVSAIQREPFSSRVTISAVLDSYSVPDILDSYDDDINGVELPVAADLSFNFLELPAQVSGDNSVGVSVFRIRAHQNISSARIYGSVENAAYVLIGSQPNPCAGGPIEDDILDTDGPDIINIGPTFETLNSDVANVLDLTSQDTEWRNGRQLAVINREVFFLKKITVQSEVAWTPSYLYSPGDIVRPSTVTGFRYRCMSGGFSGATPPVWGTTRNQDFTDGGVVWRTIGFAYRLDGLIRARFDSGRAEHLEGDTVYICQQVDVNILRPPIMQPGVTLCVKTQPTTSSQILDISGETAVCREIVGLAFGGKTFLKDNEGSYMVTHLGENIYVKET